ncbi:MAG: hypothetical protein QXO86_00390 [Nitrososphaerota archaeon]
MVLEELKESCPDADTFLPYVEGFVPETEASTMTRLILGAALSEAEASRLTQSCPICPGD